MTLYIAMINIQVSIAQRWKTLWKLKHSTMQVEQQALHLLKVNLKDHLCFWQKTLFFSLPSQNDKHQFSIYCSNLFHNSGC